MTPQQFSRLTKLLRDALAAGAAGPLLTPDLIENVANNIATILDSEYRTMRHVDDLPKEGEFIKVNLSTVIEVLRIRADKGVDLKVYHEAALHELEESTRLELLRAIQ